MGTFSFSYLLANPTRVGIEVEHPAVLFLGLAAFFFLARPARSGTRAARLRVAAFLAVVLTLSGTRLTARLPTDELTLVAAVDLSESVGEAGRKWSRRLLEDLRSRLAPGDEMPVLTFAGGTRLSPSPAKPGASIDLPLPPVPTATDLGRAVDSALGLFPPVGARRLLLITDGNETRGNVRARLPVLRGASVRVDALVPPRKTGPDVRIDKLLIPSMGTEGGILPLRIVAHNRGTTRPAVLNVFLDGLIMDSRPVELRAGLNSIDFPCQISGQGSHLVRAELSVPDDVSPANNAREVSLTLRDRSHILVATSRRHSLVADALERKGFSVDTVPPARIPSRAEDLSRYHAVVLEDVVPPAAGARSLDVLERYVAQFGGGLVLAAGARTFGAPGFVGTPLERMLPLTLEPNRPRRGSREPIALFLLIDRSNSMGYNSRLPTVRDGEKLRYAKESALAVVRQLKDQDLIGVIAFDSQPREISALRPLGQNRKQLERLLPRLVENGGTDFYGALESARTELARSRVSRRHVILLTDGDTNRSDVGEYDSLLERFARARISVTTIRIGDNTVNLNLLQRISHRTGGEFHHVENARMLPDLMLRDATRALGHTADPSQRFFPALRGASQIVEGIREQDLPPLDGYAYARAKPSAEVSLEIPRLDGHDPLLATWMYGLGRVVAFAASPAEDAEGWLSWAGYGRFWSRVVRWAARVQTPDEYAVEIHRREGFTTLAIHSFDPAGEQTLLFARLRLDADVTKEIPLTPSGSRVWTAAVTDLPAGRFPLTLVRRSSEQEASEVTIPVTIPDSDQEPQEERPDQEPNLGLLTQITDETGGSLEPTVLSIARRPAGERRAGWRLDPLLVPLAMLLFLADVAVRRFGAVSSSPQPPASQSRRADENTQSALPSQDPRSE